MRRANLQIEDDVTIGNDFDCGYNVVLRKSCKIGDRVRIWSNTVIDAGAVIGDDTRIHCNCYISQNCKIGNGVFIGPGTQLLNDKYPPRRDPMTWQPVVIEDGVAIGGSVTILPGVIVHTGAMVGAGAVVTKDVEPGAMVIGNPAHEIARRHG